MKSILRALIVEDNPDDAALLVRELGQAGYEVVDRRVDSDESMKEALSVHRWDIVLADYSLPRYSGLEAFKLVRAHDPDLPFILISGAITEDIASDMLMSGVGDFIVKGNWARLFPAVERELRQAQARRQRRQAEIALQLSDIRFRTFLNAASDMVFLKDSEYRHLFANRALAAFFGSSVDHVVGKTDYELMPSEGANSCRRSDTKALNEKSVVVTEEYIGSNCYETIKFPVALGKEQEGVGGFIRDITERKKAEDALRRSEEELRKAQRFSHMGSWTWHIPTNRLEWSEGMFGLFGIRQDEFNGDIDEIIARAIHPDDKEKVIRSNLRIIQEKVSHPMYYRVVWPDGAVRIIWAETGELVLDGEGRPALLRGYAQDVTDRVRMEDALGESEQRLRSMLDNSLAGMYRAMPDGRIFMANKTFLQMLGYETLEEITRKESDETSFTHLFSSREILTRLEQAGEVRGLEAAWKKKDGSIVYLSESARLFRNEGGQVQYCDGVVIDITDRKKAEEALIAERAIMSELIDNLPDNVFIKDTEGRIILNNVAHRRLLGRQKLEEVSGKSDREFFAPELAERYMADERSIIESGRPLVNYEEPTIDPEGRLHCYLTTKAPVKDAGGKVVALVGINRDITDRKRVEKELEIQRKDLENIVKLRTADLDDARAAAVNLMQDALIQREAAEKALATSRWMELSLQESEDRLKRILATTNEGFWLTDNLGITQEINQAMSDILGLRPDQIVGRSIFDFVDGEGAPILRKQLEIQAKGRGTSYELSLSRSDGAVVLCWFNAVPYENAKGEQTGFFAMVRDITELKRAESELRKRAEELEAFNKAMVDREMIIIEKKEEINRLCGELGREPTYPPIWEEE